MEAKYKKSRSLDLKSICKPKLSKKNGRVSVSEDKSLKRESGLELGGEGEMSGRKRKELPLSSLKTSGKNAKKSLVEVYNGVISFGCDTSKNVGSDGKNVSRPVGLNELNEDAGGNNMLLDLDGGTVQIQKKRRGFIGRKKHDVSQSLLSDNKSNFGDEEINPSEIDSSVEIIGANVMGEKDADKFVEKLISSTNPDQSDHIGHVITDKDVDSSPNKSRKKRRKKGVDQVGACTNQVTEPLLDSSQKIRDDSVEEDEKNLEENAAMMLSSRFDPSCTGFSANNKASASPTTSRSLSRPQYSGQSDSVAGSDFVSPDMADRVLRPRSRHGSKRFSRKRRHFYEVHLEQFNGRRLLNKMIKVFWPLDESWYRGLINNYDNERKLHHIKYDDRDEEWVNLHSEKFKLLLFPSEFHGRSSRRRTRLTPTDESHVGEVDGKIRKVGRKKKLTTDDEHSARNNMDTIPIISWVTRTKSSSSRSGKKQKSSVSSMHSIASLMSDNAQRPVGRINDGMVKSSASKLQKDPVLPKGYSPGRRKISPRSTIFKEKKISLPFKEDKHPIVYIRRHQKTSETLHGCDRVGSFSGGSDETERSRSHSISLQKSDSKLSYQMLQDILSKLIVPIQPEFFSLELFVPVFPLLNYYLGAQNVQFSQQGSLMMTWPKVRLDILLVDNFSGLRFLLFEGSLEEALAFCLLILQVMDHGNGVDKDGEEQLPVLSINLRFTLMQGFRKQFLFAVDRFVSLKSSKWMYIDSNLMTKCLFARRLSLSECLHGNVSVLEDYTSKLPTQFACGCLVKGLLSLKEPGISGLNCCDAVIHLFSKFKVDSTTCAFRNARVLNISKSAIIKLLVDGFYSYMMMKERNVANPLINVDDANSVGELPDIQASSNTDPCYPVSKMSKQINEYGNSYVKPVTYPRHFPQSARFLHVSHSISNGTIGVEKLARPHDEEMNDVPNSFVVNAAIVPNSNPTAPRSMHLRRRTNPSYRRLLSMGSDVKDDSSINIGFVSGVKKPRSQVSYLLPYGSFDLSPESRNCHNRIASHKRIRRLKEKDAPDASKRNFDVLSCDANVLITEGDRGWRETGAAVFLELDNQNEWKLVVKVVGTMQYSYKAHQFLQPGSTNRFTHAMMWKGGKDWVLEFTNRSQWALFKEMHEECYNRNVCAASAKTIPIPGVRVIDENEDSGSEELFFHCSSKYFHQVESDVEMALNPSRVLYDMDSEDELWTSVNCSLDAVTSHSTEFTEEVFERVMDIFEKAAYSRQTDQFSSNAIEELVAGVGPIEIVESIYDHWWKKRQKKGMPLIRHLQPPSWERYQQEVKEWELTRNKMNYTLSSECQKVSAAEKPQMFAFCMKPRGLEVPNKGSKQRSRRKFSVSGTTSFPDQDGFHSLGIRSSGNSFGNGTFLYSSNQGEFFGDFPSRRLGSPRDLASPRYLSLENDGYYNSRISRNKSKRIGALISPRDPISYSQRDAGWKNGMKQWNSDWSDHRNYYLGRSEGFDAKQLACVVADDFVIRDTSGTAWHTRKISRLKRQKAERMFHRADRAVYKALAALMAAEAIKAASEDRNVKGLLGSLSEAQKEVGSNLP